MALGKVEICGVNTAKLPLLSNEETDALAHQIELQQKNDQRHLQTIASVLSEYEDLSSPEIREILGSYASIEGITSPDGRILGKMAHSERRDRSVAINIYGEQDLKIFESGVKYFQ